MNSSTKHSLTAVACLDLGAKGGESFRTCSRCQSTDLKKEWFFKASTPGVSAVLDDVDVTFVLLSWALT